MLQLKHGSSLRCQNFRHCAFLPGTFFTGILVPLRFFEKMKRFLVAFTGFSWKSHFFSLFWWDPICVQISFSRKSWDSLGECRAACPGFISNPHSFPWEPQSAGRVMSCGIKGGKSMQREKKEMKGCSPEAKKLTSRNAVNRNPVVYFGQEEWDHI